MAQINFGGETENVVLREEFSIEKAREVLKNEIIAIIGYGVQGPAQALNMKDNGFNVIIGQAPEFKEDWDKAIRDGFVPGETLFPIEEAAKKVQLFSTWFLMQLNALIWPKIKPCLNEGDALYFSHGFSSPIRNRQVNSSCKCGCYPGCPQGIRRQCAYQFPGRKRHQLKLCSIPGLYRPRQGTRPGPGYCHRQRISFPYYISRMKFTQTSPANAVC
jgi:hypothetical protein